MKKKIAIDIGGTKTKMAVLEGGTLAPFFRAPTAQNPDEELELILRGLTEAGLREGIGSIGIGCPGPLDRATGTILSPPNLRRWDRFPLGSLLSERLGVPVKVENDANAGALGEAVYGSGKNYRNLFYMTVSTGIGTGIVIDRKVYAGKRGLAGELWCFDPVAYCRDCLPENATCPKLIKGTINDMSSGNGIVEQARELMGQGHRTSIPPQEISTRTILAAFESGDPLAGQVLRTAQVTLAASLVFVVTFLDPDIIVMGGGLCADESWIVAPVRKLLAEMLPAGFEDGVTVERAALWDEAVLYGALCL